ncbi:YfcE family phosphodiesterase [Thermogladius sp.]|uniref:YfcE family phosphodiesterase n=1 Tax=Thermogladius sp. TaxID=2023064 RepID=UPI003D10316E
MRILVIGDTHIPDRASRVPPVLLDLINRGSWDTVVFTGDLTGREVLEWVKRLSVSVYVVRGNMDYLPLPKTAVFEAGSFKMGVHHGDRVYPRGDIRQLTEIAVRLGVSVLFSGHTHSPFVEVDSTGRYLHINPGSLTGVWGGGDASMTPSMADVEVLGRVIRVRLYELRDGGVRETSKCFSYEGGVFRYC